MISGLENDRAPLRNIDRCKVSMSAALVLLLSHPFTASPQGMRCDASFLCTAGRVSVCCLDKTGTITFEDVTLHNVSSYVS